MEIVEIIKTKFSRLSFTNFSLVKWYTYVIRSLRVLVFVSDISYNRSWHVTGSNTEINVMTDIISLCMLRSVQISGFIIMGNTVIHWVY